jgi:DNA-binding MarR family transcriptional regulator
MSTLNKLAADKVSQCLATTFAQVGPLWVRWCHGHLRRTGLSFARMKLLGVLDMLGPQIMSDVSEELGVTRRNVTALVDALEAEGLVKRTPHPTDRRATVIALTPAGKEASNRVRKEFESKVLELFGHLPLGDQRMFQKLLDRAVTLLRGNLGGHEEPDAGKK